MQPTKPVCEGLEMYETCLGGPENDQPEYMPLPVLRAPDGRVVCRWTLTPEERQDVLKGADVCLMVYCQGQLPPVSLYITTNPHHASDNLRQLLLLDDGMELKMLGETVRRADEELQKAQKAFGEKSQQIGEKLKSCLGSSSTSEGSGQQNSASSGE